MNDLTEVCVLVAQQGIGDHYIVAGFAEAITRKHKIKVWMAGRKDLAFIAKLFPAVQNYITWPDHLNAESIMTTIPCGGSYFFAHFPRLDLARAIGYKNFHFLDAYRVRLSLPEEAELSTANLPSNDELIKARDFLAKHKCPVGKTIILNIDARTTAVGGVDSRYWPLLASALRVHGLYPLANIGPKTQIHDGMRGAPLELSEYRAIVMAAGGICSVRSGISDLVSGLPVPQVVVYPDTRYQGGPLIRGTTLSKFGLTSSPLEIIASRGNSKNNILLIAKHLASELNLNSV